MVRVDWQSWKPAAVFTKKLSTKLELKFELNFLVNTAAESPTLFCRAKTNIR